MQECTSRALGPSVRSFLRSLTLAALIFTSLCAQSGACAAHKINVHRPSSERVSELVTFLRVAFRARQSLTRPLLLRPSVVRPLYKKPFLEGLSRSPILMNNAGPKGAPEQGEQGLLMQASKVAIILHRISS